MNQGSGTSSYKSPDSKYLRYIIAVVTTQICCCIMKESVDNMEMKRRGCVPIERYLQSEGWICLVDHSLLNPSLDFVTKMILS